MEMLAIIAFLLIMVQGILSYFQVRNYKSRMTELRHQGVLGVGMRKSMVGQGSLVILVSDRQGRIVNCEEMTGVTVFTRFKKKEGYDGKSIYEVKENLLKTEKQSKKDNKKKNPLLQAVESIEKQLKYAECP